jgi:hypothetical protein
MTPVEVAQCSDFKIFLFCARDVKHMESCLIGKLPAKIINLDKNPNRAAYTHFLFWEISN